MELFFPMLFLFALAISAVLATACMLFPQPKHLSRDVFFATMGFFLGGAIGAIVFITILGLMFAGFPGRLSQRADLTFDSAVFLFCGVISAWLTLKMVWSFLESTSTRAGK
jgi:cytochrome bd-type quinol oxidase subunit 2